MPFFKLTKVKYSDLNGRQKEIYNFQVVAGKLAEYGFNCIKLADDWQGADFLAYHKDGQNTLKVQLKARLAIHEKYEGKGLYVAFPCKGEWYLLKHDVLVKKLGQLTGCLETDSWRIGKSYHTAAPSKNLLEGLSEYKL